MNSINQTPVVIDADYIRALRLGGHKAEADALLKAYYDNKKQSTLQLRKELFSQEKKKLSTIAKRYGVCSCCKIRDARENRATCELCANLKEVN